MHTTDTIPVPAVSPSTPPLPLSLDSSSVRVAVVSLGFARSAFEAAENRWLEAKERYLTDHLEVSTHMKEARERSGHTLRDVARVTGFHYSYLSMLENGKKPWSAQVLEAYASALALPVQPRNPGGRPKKYV